MATDTPPEHSRRIDPAPLFDSSQKWCWVDRGTVAAWVGAIILALGWAAMFTQPFSGIARRGSDQPEGTVAGVQDPQEPSTTEILVRVIPPGGGVRTYPVPAKTKASIAEVLREVETQFRATFTLTEFQDTGDFYLTGVDGRDSILLASWVVYRNGDRIEESVNRTTTQRGDTIELRWERNPTFAD